MKRPWTDQLAVVIAVLLPGAFAAPAVGRAQEKSAPAAPTAVDTVVVTAKASDTAGTAISASSGVVGGIELSQRPILRQGEVLEAVPGLIVTAHTSGGKANQYYLRGFNLDHGTDFATSVDGVPVNLGTHAHGQGYMDLNWLIPELVAGIAFRKGPYYADAGDFSAAGNASIAYLSTTPGALLQLEAGTDGYGRALVTGSASVGPGRLLYAGEYIRYDGPSAVSSDYRRPNGVLKYTVGDARAGGGVTLQAYDARWVPADQIPERAIPTLRGGRFGLIDASETGHTSRYSLVAEAHWSAGAVAHRVDAFIVKYGLNLYSDFSYFVDQDHGDQFRQYDNRVVAGGSERTTITGDYLGARTEDAFGVQLRSDFVNTELDHTEARAVLQDYRSDQAVINAVGLYWSNAIIWSPWLRTEAGLRLDAYRFHLTSDVAANGGDTSAVRPEPKLGVTLTPFAGLNLYAQGGVSYRSNDARGIFDTVPSYVGGPDPVSRSKPLVRSEGGEVGVRATIVPKLTATAALWYLRSTSELFFAGDTGADEDTDRPGHRYGIEVNTISHPCRWLTVDADFALSQAFFSDRQPVGNQIPEAIKTSASASVIVHDLPAAPHVTGSLRMRYFGARDLVEDGSQHSSPVTVFNARLSYDVVPRATLGLELLNLLNTKYNDAEYYDATRLKGEPANPGAEDGAYFSHVIHPGEPLEVRFSVALHY